MKWRRQNDTSSISDKGYLVTAGRYADKWLYTAWGPENDYWPAVRKYIKSKAGGEPPPPLKVTYAPGEAVPQPRDLISTWADPAQAAQACNDHWGSQESVSGRAA